MRPAHRRVFRALLICYPREFRQAYADDMTALFTDRWAEARRQRRLLRFWMRTSANLIATGVAERWTARRAAARRRALHHRSALMFGIVQDARYALRLLRRQPAFSLFVVLTLAVGIGANTAVFSVVNRVLLRPLPYPESDRLVRVYGRFDAESGREVAQFSLSNPEYLDYKNHTRALEDVAAFSPNSITVGGSGAEPERVPSANVTANLFNVLRVAPALGRGISADEARPGAPWVVVLSHGYWQTRFGGNPSVLGQVVPLNGTPATIIGVMPADFAFPRDTTRLWVPLRIDPANPGGRASHNIHAIGRQAPGVPLETARAELDTLMRDWKARFPQIHTGHYLFLRPMLEDVAGPVRPALLLLLGATGFVLLIVCANVASVVLARGEARLREMAIRGALGAGRRRLVRLALIESGIMAVAGGVLGLVLAWAAVRGLLSIDPTSIPRATELGVDYRMVLFAAAVSVICAALFGLMPAIRGARADLQQTLRDASQSASGGIGRQLFRRALVVAEVALTVMLVLGAALMLRSFARLTAVDPGFRAAGLISGNLALPVRAYPEHAQVEAFYASLMDRLASMPGVEAVSAGTTVPFWSDAGTWDIEIEGRPLPASGQPGLAARAAIVRAGYLETLGVPIVRGRAFNDEDDAQSLPVTVINRTLADKYFGQEDPIGRRVKFAGMTSAEPWMTVIGVSGDVRIDSLDTEPTPAYYFLQSQLPRTNGNSSRSMAIFVRSSGDPGVAMTAVRAAVRELDASLAVFDLQTLDSVVDRSVARPRFTTWLLGLFAGIGLLLGASGIYGVLAYTVARRTQEIGIRRALGAPPGRLAREVVAGGMVPVALGLAAGLVGSYWSSRYWSAQLFDVSAGDPAIHAVVAAGVVLIAVIAMIVPVRRALKVSPLVALRAD